MYFLLIQHLSYDIGSDSEVSNVFEEVRYICLNSLLKRFRTVFFYLVLWNN